MKLETIQDPMLYHSAQIYEPNSKPPQHNGNTLTDTELKEANGTFCGFNDYENEADPLPFKLNNGDRILKIPDLHCYTRGSSLRKESADDVKDALELDDTNFYTDKSVTECGLPELIICYKDNYTVGMKDICVDEGLPLVATSFVENCNEGKLGISSSFSRQEDKVDIVLPVLEELKASDNYSGNICVDEGLPLVAIKHSDVVDSGSNDFTESGMKMFIFGDILHRSLREDSEHISTASEIEDYECPVAGELKSSAENVCCGEGALGTGDLIQNAEVINDFKCIIQRDDLKPSVANTSMNYDIFDNEDIIHNMEAVNDGEEETDSTRATITGSKGKHGMADSIQNVEGIHDSEYEIERGELDASVENASTNKEDCDIENLVQNTVAIEHVKKETESVEVESVADVCGDGEESCTEHFIQTHEENKDLKNEVDGDVREKLEAENGYLQQDLSMENSLSKSSENIDPVDKLSSQMASADKVATNPILDSSKEVLTSSSVVDDLSYNSKVGSASITFHFDPSSPGASGRTETPSESRNSLSREDDVAYDRQKFTSHIQRGDLGESSFATFPGLITYSGSIANSGSMSHRSDSSATSAHSFAFPILPGEWNSSPVRMAKADRRHFRKHRGWKKIILCCRF